jgi:hypothetical protein
LNEYSNGTFDPLDYQKIQNFIKEHEMKDKQNYDYLYEAI